VRSEAPNEAPASLVNHTTAQAMCMTRAILYLYFLAILLVEVFK
jgi:hypothetical protein